jgi:hypothetical protein
MYPGVPVNVGDIDVIDDVDVVGPAIVAVPVPAVIALVGGKRHPADVPEAHAHADV